MAARVDFAVASGTSTLDGRIFAVDNGVRVVGDDAERLAAATLRLLGGNASDLQ